MLAMTLRAASSFACLLLALAGCDGPTTSATPPASASAAAVASVPPAPAASLSAPVAAATAAPPPAPAIPAIPTERSKPPSKKEWDAAEKINTAPESEHHPSCWLKRVREWVRAECLGHEGGSVSWGEELGSTNSDWFPPQDPNAFILILRMRQGFDTRARIDHHSRRNGTYLRIDWGEGGDRPKEISLSSKPATSPGIRALPQFPSERSKPPTVAEWQAAHEVNTIGISGRQTECRIRVVREWVKLACSVQLPEFEEPEVLGTKNSDWFMSRANGLDLVFRFKPNTDLSLPTNGGRFKAVWPQGANQPKDLSVGFEQG